jgi:hypothetical protein
MDGSEMPARRAAWRADINCLGGGIHCSSNETSMHYDVECERCVLEVENKGGSSLGDRCRLAGPREGEIGTPV